MSEIVRLYTKDMTVTLWEDVSVSIPTGEHILTNDKLCEDSPLWVVTLRGFCGWFEYHPNSWGFRCLSGQ